MKIIPAIDLYENKSVRLFKGKFSQKKVYYDNPLTQSLELEREGFTRLHLVDLEGAKSGSPVHVSILEEIAKKTKLSIDYSGGIRSPEEVSKMLSLGASQICIGSFAVSNPEEFKNWLREFGPEKLVLSLDLLDGEIRTQGWVSKSKQSWKPLIESFLDHGLKKVISTDISRDGTLTGPSISLYKEILKTFPTLELIASGGIRNHDDLRALESIGVQECILGKALHQKETPLKYWTDYA